MKNQLKGKLIVLLCLTCLIGGLNAQVWSKSFSAGGYDINNNFLGGSEVLQLVNHKNQLFASVGYWEDQNNIWYGGSNMNIGWGQINRLDQPAGAWNQDLSIGASYLRPEILKQLIFTKDQFGNPLPSADTVLICAGFSPNYLTNTTTVKSFVRNDINGTWSESQITQGNLVTVENFSTRAIQVYTDQQTGLEYVFASVGTLGIFKGKYNPAAQGKIDWINVAEFGPLDVRSLGITITNGSLHFSAGDKLYRRIDGTNANYVVAHDFSDLNSAINSAVGGIRGLTTLENSNGNQELLLMWCPNGQSQGIIYRLEPDGSAGYNRIYETKLSVLIENYLPGAAANYVLGAYNDFYQYINPINSDTSHIIGFEVMISGGGHQTWNGYYSGGLFAKRNTNGQYSIEEINGAISGSAPDLVANRCYVASPFANENALYFGGFDPNGNSATNMAWVYKKDFQANAVANENNLKNTLFIHPNPAKNRLFVEHTNLENQEFSIINLIGKQVKIGNLGVTNTAIDISGLPAAIYMFKVGNQAIKFIKVN